MPRSTRPERVGSSLCRSFGVTRGAARAQPEARGYVVAQTKAGC